MEHPSKLTLLMVIIALCYNQWLFYRGDLAGLPRTHVAEYDSAAMAAAQGAQALQPSQWVRLPFGNTRYQLQGPEDGELVVFIHGIATPGSIAFRQQIPPVLLAGYRVLLFDLFGRGWSDSPTADYKPDFFVQQTVNLLYKLGYSANTTFNLVGLSMGGAVAARLAQLYPEQVRRLVLLAPAGGPNKNGFLAKLLTVPGFGELVLQLFGRQVLRGLLARGFYEPEKNAALMLEGERFINMVTQDSPGFNRAMLSTLRAFPLMDMLSTFEEVGTHGRPVLLVWGKYDITCPYENHKLMMQAMPRAELLSIDNAAHNINWEAPEEINKRLVEFLRRPIAA